MATQASGKMGWVGLGWVGGWGGIFCEDILKGSKRLNEKKTKLFGQFSSSFLFTEQCSAMSIS